jgi:hypothetical protein
MLNKIVYFSYVNLFMSLYKTHSESEKYLHNKVRNRLFLLFREPEFINDRCGFTLTKVDSEQMPSLLFK